MFEVAHGSRVADRAACQRCQRWWETALTGTLRDSGGTLGYLPGFGRPSGGRYEADSDAERPAAGQSAVNAGPERVRVPRSAPRRRSCCRSCPSSLELNRRAARGCTSGAPRWPQQRPNSPRARRLTERRLDARGGLPSLVAGPGGGCDPTRLGCGRWRRGQYGASGAGNRR